MVISEINEVDTIATLGIILRNNTITEIQEGLMIIEVVMDSEISREEEVIITIVVVITAISITPIGEVVITIALLIIESMLFKIRMDGLLFKVQTMVVSVI